jgi:hypothetical protein
MTGICSDVCEGEGKETGSDMFRRLCLGDENGGIRSKGRNNDLWMSAAGDHSIN